MEYESGRAPKEKRVKVKISRTGVFILIASLLAAFCIAAAGYLLPEKARTVSAALVRTKNALSFLVFSGTPHFYSLVVEKNGEDHILSTETVFEVSSRDQFIVKKIETDVLSGKGIGLNIEGAGNRDDFGKLVKGMELCDKIVSAGKNEGAEKGGGKLSFFVFFQAEDGIRDWSVTGVQTCALPISPSAKPLASYMGFPTESISWCWG